MGIYYKHLVNDKFAFRFALGFQNKYSWQSIEEAYLIDHQTLIYSEHRKSIKGFQFSVGAERNVIFYKNFYISAAVDIAIGYGVGESYSNYKVFSQFSNNHSQKLIDEYNSSSWKFQNYYLNLNPFLGIHWLKNNIKFGIETSFLNAGFWFDKHEHSNQIRISGNLSLTPNTRMTLGIVF